MIWTDEGRVVIGAGTKGEYRLKERGGPVWNIYLNGELLAAKGTLTAAKQWAEQHDQTK